MTRIDLRSSRGASALEYALLIAGIGAVIVVAALGIGRVSAGHYGKLGSCLTATTCTAAATIAPVVAPSATPTPTPTPTVSTPAPVPTPTPTSTRRGNGNGNGNNNDD